VLPLVRHQAPGTRHQAPGTRHQGDAKPKRFELADVIAGLAVCVDAAGVVAGAEVVVVASAVGEQICDLA
jgi:hypothetical protein